MSNYSQRMADLLLADQTRWQARQDAENAPSETSRAALEDYSCERPLLRGMGMILPPRKYPHAMPRTRIIGVAAPAPDADAIARLAACDVNATVRVIHTDGSNTILPASHFHRTRATSVTSRTVETETPHRTTSADLPALNAD